MKNIYLIIALALVIFQVKAQGISQSAQSLMQDVQ